MLSRKFEWYISSEKKSLISGPFGSNISSKFFVDEGVPVIRGNNLNSLNKKFNDDGFVFITEEKAKELNCFAYPDDIIFTAVGTIGQVGIITDNLKYKVYTISNKQIRARIDKSKIDISFAYIILNSLFVRNQIIKGNTGSTVPLINLSTVRNLLIPQIDLLTQQKIASVLSALDDKIELNNKINAELEAMAKTLYDYWFMQFDFPDADGKPYKSSGGEMVYNEVLKREIPKGWEVKSLGEYCKIKKGTLVTEKTANLEGKVKVVSAGLNYSYFHSISNYPSNTITISASGANAGYVNFWREPIFACDCTTVRAKTDVETLFVLNFLNSVQQYIYNQARGSAQPHVYPKDIEQLLTAIPSNLLFKKSEPMFISLNDKITNNLKQNQELASLRDWLLPMLMNGQVTVAGAYKEVEETLRQAQDDTLAMVAEGDVKYGQ